jgi:hypothetical protein
MHSRNTSRSRTVLVALLGLLLLALVVLPAGAARWVGDAWNGLAGPARSVTTGPLDGTNVAYTGMVELEWAVPGQFSDPLPTPTPDPQAPPPPDLGEIDLGLALIRSGDTISGYVELDFTLVFTRRHQVGAVWYGPSVTGTFDGADLALTSERLGPDVIAGLMLNRQFRLTGGAVPDQEGRLGGEYRETIWGYGSQPLTIMGTFTLVEAVSDRALVDWVVYLPLVMK